MGYRASLYFVDTEAWDSKRQCKVYGKGGMQKSTDLAIPHVV